MRMRTESKYLIFDNPIKPGMKYFLRKSLGLVQVLFCKFALCFVRPKVQKNAKYNIVICAIFKNEAPYLKEWIEYHKIIGVEHFYLYNNNSSDNYEEILRPYVESGEIDLIDWPQAQGQIPAYRHCMETYRKTAKWIGFIDLDEYVVPRKDVKLGDFLQNFKRVPSVAIYWKMFGTSGRLNRELSGLVTEDFVVCWKKHVDIGKCFYNTAYRPDMETSMVHHRFISRDGLIRIPPVNIFGHFLSYGRNVVDSNDFPIQINHYFTKSYWEYITKTKKGDVFFKVNPHDEEYFYRHESPCMDTDYSAYRYLIPLKLNMGQEAKRDG